MFGTYNSMGYDTIYVLGAGFSVPAGLPLSDRLLPLVFRKAYETRTPDCDSKWGHAQLLLDALNFYCPGIRFSPKAILDGRVPKRFNFERFLTYVSAISATQADTTEFVDEHGNQQLSYFKAWSAQVIQELEKESMIRGLPTMYSQFALNLKTSIVLTFNWDTILESILFASGIEFQLDRKRLTLPPAVMLHKLHGSINWFKSNHCCTKPWMQLEQIGPSLPHLSIATEQVDVLGRYYDCGMTPHIVLPSYDKIYQVMRFEGLWQMPYLSFQNRMKVCIIGYSLRPDDFHAHALIYPQLVHGSREGYLDVRVIDFAENKKQEDAVRARYKHVVGCKFWFQGFNDASLDFLSQ